MAVSIESGGRGRRKSVSADLLLVPYIDLLTCMIAFLLITAVWTQLARLEVQQRGQGDVDGNVDPLVCIAVVVHEEGYAVVVDHDQHPVPRRAGAYDYEALTAELRRQKAAHPDKSDLQIVSADAIKFETLIATMDAAMSAGFPAVSLLDAAGSTI
jgi:biopolymer transport protein ExbD